jgi:ABC-type glutathione transport system ATPase component
VSDSRVLASTVLDVDGIDVHYGLGRRRHRALSGVSLRVAAGEAVGLIGETGSGKTTFARAVLGLAHFSAGRVVIDGTDVSHAGSRQWREVRRRGVAAYVFQDPLRSLDPDLSVEASLIEPLLIGGVPKPAAVERARAKLALVRLDPVLLGKLPGELSGGQRQRVAVARALVTEPKLLILDEPVSALDAANRVVVLETLKELRAAGVSLVFISHDLGSVAGVANRIGVLYRGELVELGPTADIVNRPQHPYTRLLLSSAPTLRSAPADRAERDALRELLHV